MHFILWKNIEIVPRVVQDKAVVMGDNWFNQFSIKL